MHRLVAAYLDYSPASVQAPTQHADDNHLPAWLQGMTPLPSPSTSQDPISADEAVTLFQRQFFGDVHVYK